MADPPIPAPGSLSQPPSSQVLPTGDTDTIPFDPSAPLVEYWRRCNIHYTPAEARQVKQVQVEFKPPSREPSARSSVVSYPADMVFRVAAPMSYMSEHGGDLHVPQRGGRPAPWSVPFRIAPRSVVTAGQGNTLVSVDYSQVHWCLGVQYLERPFSWADCARVADGASCAGVPIAGCSSHQRAQQRWPLRRVHGAG